MDTIANRQCGAFLSVEHRHQVFVHLILHISENSFPEYLSTCYSIKLLCKLISYGVIAPFHCHEDMPVFSDHSTARMTSQFAPATHFTCLRWLPNSENNAASNFKFSGNIHYLSGFFQFLIILLYVKSYKWYLLDILSFTNISFFFTFRFQFIQRYLYNFYFCIRTVIQAIYRQKKKLYIYHFPAALCRYVNLSMLTSFILWLSSM